MSTGGDRVGRRSGDSLSHVKYSQLPADDISPSATVAQATENAARQHLSAAERNHEATLRSLEAQEERRAHLKLDLSAQSKRIQRNQAEIAQNKNALDGVSGAIDQVQHQMQQGQAAAVAAGAPIGGIIAQNKADEDVRLVKKVSLWSAVGGAVVSGAVDGATILAGAAVAKTTIAHVVVIGGLGVGGGAALGAAGAGLLLAGRRVKAYFYPPEVKK